MKNQLKIKTAPLVSIIALILIFVLGGIYFYKQSKDKKNNDDKSSSEVQSEITTTENTTITTTSGTTTTTKAPAKTTAATTKPKTPATDEAIEAYKSLSYFNSNNLQRYIDYKSSNTSLPYEQAILYVNIGLDHPFYTNTHQASNCDSIAVLVNKYSSLPNNYAPSDLVSIAPAYNVGGQKMRKEAATAFEKMCGDAAAQGYIIKASSAFRSYSTQNGLYNNYVKTDGQQDADTYSARAGYSEHQTGLAVDVRGGQTNYEQFAKTKENTFVLNNAYKYGFIVRYTQDKVKITGYMAEPWHLRYVGVDIATKIQNEKISYDEYCAKYVK